jgi:hypothetical protein
MADFGSYSSPTIFTPSNILPEPSNDITYDWMDAIAQYSQRFNQELIIDAVITGSHGINYSSLGCDYFPPIIKVYDWVTGTFYQPTQKQYILYDLTLSGGTFINTDVAGTFRFIIYK